MDFRRTCVALQLLDLAAMANDFEQLLRDVFGNSVDKLMLAASEQCLFGMALDLLGPARMAPSSRPHGLDADQIIKGYLYGRSASVYGGSEQIQRTLIAERLLGLPRSR